MEKDRLVDLLDAVRGVRAAVMQMEEKLLSALAAEQGCNITEAQRSDTADEWFTLAELGDWLKVSRTTAYRLIRDGHIPAYRIGRITRIRRRDVERWLEEEGKGR
jgi:excisionase family DNA binding protein